MLTTGFVAFLVVLGCASALWLLSLAIRDASIADPFWGPGFAILASVCFLRSAATGPRAVLIFVLTVVWGLRLGAYLTWRKSRHGEDRRYTAMRDHHGARFWWVSLFTVFLFQAFLIYVISMPVQFGIHRGGTLNWLDGVGVAVWGLGMFFETVGDIQLTRFKSNPGNAGRVLDKGLWRYTRHPNYFGDFCVWWGIFLVALAAGCWWTLIGPLTISFLLLKVSGVAMLEKTIAGRRPEYADYVERTNAFFPGPPSKPKSNRSAD